MKQRMGPKWVVSLHEQQLITNQWRSCVILSMMKHLQASFQAKRLRKATQSCHLLFDSWHCTTSSHTTNRCHGYSGSTWLNPEDLIDHHLSWESFHNSYLITTIMLMIDIEHFYYTVPVRLQHGGWCSRVHQVPSANNAMSHLCMHRCKIPHWVKRKLFTCTD